MADTLTLRPGPGAAAFTAVSLSTGSESSYVLIGTLRPSAPGVVIIQGDVGSGNGLGGLKIAAAATQGGTDVALASDSAIDTAGVARGFLDVVGDGTHGLYQTAASSSFRIQFLWLAGGDLNVYAKRADNSAATTLTLTAAMGPLPAEIPSGSQTTTLGGSATLAANANVSCAAGTSAVDLSLGTGTFKSTTGAHTLGGAVTVNDATTPSVSLATGKTNTGFFLVNGKTSGSFKIITADATAQAVVASVSAQTAGGCTLSIPDQAGVSSSFVFTTLAQTLTNKTVTSPVIATGLTASGSASNNFSGSTGAFQTSSGANTLNGAVSVADATTPSITTVAGSTNTGFVQINGKTSGALKFLPADATGQTVTVVTAGQTSGAATLTIPDCAGVAQSFIFTALTQTLTNKTLTTPTVSGMKQATTNALTAAGTTRADALALTNDFNRVTTAGSGTGVVLPASTVGATVTVFNAGANAMQVYGAGSDTIDGVAGSTGVPLTNAKRAQYFCVATNTWISAQLGVVSA